ELRREQVESRVVDLYGEFRARYGAPRLARELNAKGIKCSVNYVAGIMRAQGIKARNGKGFHYSDHSLAMNNVAENLLRRRFNATAPNEKWVTDITYIWVKEKWLYLATVMDLYSRRIVGWALDRTMTEKLAMDA